MIYQGKLSHYRYKTIMEEEKPKREKSSRDLMIKAKNL